MPEHSALEKRKWVRLTRACNNRCLFCLDEEAQDGTMLPYSAVARELRAGIKAGCRRAVLSGGDPTVHPDFHRIISLASRLGYGHVQAISNGRMFCYPDFLSAAVSAGLSEITFSVHGPTAAIHDALTGMRGSFAQTLAALKAALRVPGLVVSSDIVVNRLNVDGLEPSLRLLYGLGVREFDLLQIMPFGRAWKNWDKLSYDQAKKRKALDRAFSWAGAPGVHLWTNRFDPALFEGREGLIQDPSKLLDEVRGRGEMFKGFLAGGPLDCAGGRCRYCVLRAFCEDLGELRREGMLQARPLPPCLGGRARAGRVKLCGGLDKAAAFFVAKRLTVKGSACRRCPAGGSCAGAPVRIVMARGFASLSPARAGKATGGRT